MRLALLGMLPLFLHPDGDPSGNAAVADPPAGDAPALEPPVRQDATPPITPIQKALAEAKEAVAKGEIAFDPDAPSPDEAAKEGEKPPDPTTPPADSQKPAGDAPAEGTEGAGAEAAAEEAALLTVELPTRNKGEEAVAIKVPDKETAEALRHLKNGFMRGEEVRAERRQVEADKAELAYFQELAQVDPVGLVLEQMDPAMHPTLVKHLLATPGVVEEVISLLQKWDGNEDARRADVAELRAERATQAGEIRQTLEVKARAREVGRYVGETVQKLAALVPQDLQPAFVDDALVEVQKHYTANKLRGKIPADQFPVVLATRLKVYGIDRARALAAVTDQPASPPASNAARPTGQAAEELAATAKGRTATGQRLVEAAKVRREVAAAVPGAGAGVSTPRIQPPAKQGIMERLNWARKNLTGYGA